MTATIQRRTAITESLSKTERMGMTAVEKEVTVRVAGSLVTILNKVGCLTPFLMEYDFDGSSSWLREFTIPGLDTTLCRCPVCGNKGTEYYDAETAERVWEKNYPAIRGWHERTKQEA